MRSDGHSSQLPNRNPSRQRRRHMDYPALTGCLSRGRMPSPVDIETVAARMWTELGRDRRQPWAGLPEDDPRRRQLIKAARAALAGEAGPDPTPLGAVPYGH